MPKLNLVIADEDEDYAANLLAYLAEDYCERFKVTVFTKYDYLAQYLNEGKCRVDILLTTVEMFKKEFDLPDYTILIYLGSGFIEAGYKAYKHIDKYRHAELLASDITEIYAESCSNDLDTIKKRRDTTTVTVYSPSGGVGKTTIAIGLSIVAARKGLSVFYLNLEYNQSTSVFLNGVNSNTLSTVLYHIRQKSSNLPVRIESSSCMDNEFGVTFFLPPDSPRDIEDLIVEDLEVLIERLKSSCKFDILIIDLPDSFDKRSKYALKCSDTAVFVTGQDKLSRTKLANFISELERTDMNTDSLKTYRKYFLLNKYINTVSDESRTEAIGDITFDLNIPFINGVDLSKDMNRALTQHSEYANSMDKLLTSLYK